LEGHTVLRKTFLRPAKQSLFTLLSLADLALTWWLVKQSAGHVYEANPLAHWCLARAGWAGLACFKAAIVLLVLTLVGLIVRRSPATADRLLNFACAAVALVVLYSTFLCGTTRAFAEQALLARRVCRCDAQDIPALVARLRAAGLGLRLVHTARGKSPASSAYLTTTNKEWGQLQALPRMVEYASVWRGTVFCEQHSGQWDNRDPEQKLLVQEWGDGCLIAGRFWFTGDPDLLARIRACLD
jgi:hypothetical protein